jgi:hypothetical protein
LRRLKMIQHNQLCKLKAKGVEPRALRCPAGTRRRIMKTRVGKLQRKSPIFRDEVRIIRRDREYEDLVAPGSTADDS